MRRARGHRHTVAILTIAIIALVGLARAGVPRKMNYQLRLTNPKTGGSVQGRFDLHFGIYTSATGGPASVWEEEQLGIDVDTSGVITTVLGAQPSNPIEVAFDEYDGLWLDVAIKTKDAPNYTYTPLLPRRELVSVPYALQALKSSHAADADSLAGLPRDSLVVKREYHSITAEMLAFDVVGSIEAGENIQVLSDGNTITISTTAGGDITDVVAGDGLAGGGDEGEVTLSVSTGDGLEVAEDKVRLTADYLDGSAYDFVTDSLGSVTGSMIKDGTITDADISAEAAIDASKIYSYPGSGLNADYLGGKDAAGFARAEHWHSSLNASDSLPANVITVDAEGRVAISAGPGISGDKSVELPDSAISAREILDEPGVAAKKSPANVQIGSGVTKIMEVEIIPPSDGYALIIGTATVIVRHPSGGDLYCEVGVSDVDDGIPDGYGVECGVPSMSGSGGSGDFLFPVTAQRVFAVSKNQETTFYLLGQRHGSGTTEAYDCQLTAMFLPSYYGN